MSLRSSTLPPLAPFRASVSTRGATLIEVVVATIVLGIAVPPLVAIYAGVSTRNVDSILQSVALGHADSMLEEIASKAYEDPDLGSGSFGTEEVGRAAFDDVDDFDGRVESPPTTLDGTLLDDYTGFTRSVIVVNVTAGDPDAAVPEADGSTDLKRVTVTVTWTGGRGGEFELSTLRANLQQSSSPIDEAASVLTASESDSDELTLDLVSVSASDLVLDSFDLSANVATKKAKKLKLDDEKIWEVSNGSSLPITGASPNEGSTSDRTIDAGSSPELRIEFHSNPSGTVMYTLVLHFTDGSSAHLEFSIAW